MSDLLDSCGIYHDPPFRETFAAFPEVNLYCGLTQGNAHSIRHSGDHEGFVVSWILAGDGRYESPTGNYRINEQCVCLRRPGHEYHLEFFKESEHRRCYLRISEEAYYLLIKLCPKLATMPPVLPFPFDLKLYALFQDMIKRMLRTSQGELYHLFSDMVALILTLTRANENEEETPLEKGKRLLAQVHGPRNLGDVAAACGLTYRTFRKRFAQAYGVTPGQFRIQCRIREAKQALLEGCSVQEVSDMLYYSDIYAFSHQFTQITGFSPRAYKRQAGAT